MAVTCPRSPAHAMLPRGLATAARQVCLSNYAISDTLFKREGVEDLAHSLFYN